MIISDLNHLETVSDSASVTGGKRGENKNNRGGKKKGSLNFNIVNQISIPIAIAINLGSGTAYASAGSWQFSRQ